MLGEISNYGQCSNINITEISNDEWVLELEDIEKDTGRIWQKLSKSQRDIKGTRHKFIAGDVLYSKLRTYLNKVLVAPSNGYCTTEIIPIQCIIIEPLYLNHVLRSNYYLDYTASLGYGVKMPRLGTNDALISLIPIPPIQEQQRIVAEIEKWFNIIDAIEKDAIELDSFIKQTKAKVLDLAIQGKLVPQDPTDEPAINLLKRINPNFEPCDNSHYENVPDGWEIVRFKDVFKSLSTREHQIQQKEIAEIGEIPVISQSANYIEGYSNQKDKTIYPQNGVIIFGDHTRVVKYIDFPFIVGADGVKIIQTNIYDKFAYYLILYTSLIIENKGYSRHFQFLSKSEYIIPPLEEQKRIADKITQIWSMIETITAEL